MTNSSAITLRADVYTRVTDKIVADLERGVRPWFRPWNAEHAAGRITRPLRANGQAYKGINILMLWVDATLKGFACPIWMTYRQALELGGQVRKGEHGSLVVYIDKITRTETADNGEELEHEIPFMRGYTVFNCEQIDGLPAHYYATAAPPAFVAERIAAAESFVANTSATVRHGGNRAFYSVAGDYVQMPPFECFRDRESYYATLLHELTHWTKHEARLNREFGRKRWGDAGYAAEELVAELGSAFLSADLGVTAEPRDDHSSYLASWLEVLKSDKRAIFTASAHAQRAADYLHGLQQRQETGAAA
jgi:antirestriction protein ArdC